MHTTTYKASMTRLPAQGTPSQRKLHKQSTDAGNTTAKNISKIRNELESALELLANVERFHGQSWGDAGTTRAIVDKASKLGDMLVDYGVTLGL